MEDTYVQHEFTLGDVDKLARVAANSGRGRSFDYVDRYDAAWHAIAVRLCEDEPPTRGDLIEAGMRAISEDVHAHHRHHGYDYATAAARPAYERYWEVSRSVSSPEDQIIDRLALHQIWPTLSDTHREILTAMALYGDHVLAAEAVGRTYATFTSHLKNARRGFFALWHQGEVPSRVWGKADRRRSKRRTAVQVMHERGMQRKRRAVRRSAVAS